MSSRVRNSKVTRKDDECSVRGEIGLFSGNFNPFLIRLLKLVYTYYEVFTKMDFAKPEMLRMIEISAPWILNPDCSFLSAQWKPEKRSFSFECGPSIITS